MLNLIALVFEVLGFGLTAIEIYSPKKADFIEHQLDKYSNISRLNMPTPDFSLAKNQFQFIVSASLICSVGAFLIILAAGMTAWWVFLLPPVTVIGVYFYMLPILGFLFVIRFSIYILSIFLKVPIYVSNKIHPNESAIGGAGLLIAATGLSLDLLQIIWLS